MLHAFNSESLESSHDEFMMSLFRISLCNIHTTHYGISKFTYMAKKIYIAARSHIDGLYSKLRVNEGTCKSQSINAIPTYSAIGYANSIGCWNCTDPAADYILHSVTQVRYGHFAGTCSPGYITPNRKCFR